MSFPDEALTRDAFLGGRVALWQPRRGYRSGADAVFLAAFVAARPGEAVLELGCGAGAAAICLAARVPGLELHGLELQPAYAALARRNAAENGVTLAVHEGDLAAMPAALRARRFDHVMANPPYHPTGTRSPDPGRAAAQAEGTPLEAWIEGALRRLKPGGRFAIIHRADRLGRILGALEGRAGAAAVLPLAPREGRPASRVLVRARNGSRAPLVLLPPLVLHAGEAHERDAESYTPEAAKVLREIGGLVPEGEAR